MVRQAFDLCQSDSLYICYPSASQFFSNIFLILQKGKKEIIWKPYRRRTDLQFLRWVNALYGKWTHFSFFFSGSHWQRFLCLYLYVVRFFKSACSTVCDITAWSDFGEGWINLLLVSWNTHELQLRLEASCILTPAEEGEDSPMSLGSRGNLWAAMPYCRFASILQYYYHQLIMNHLSFWSIKMKLFFAHSVCHHTTHAFVWCCLTPCPFCLSQYPFHSH